MTRKIDGKTAGEWEDRGRDFYNQGRYEDAIKCCERALELKPGDDQIGINLEIAREELKKEKKRMPELKIRPKDASAWNNRGVFLYELGRYGDAIACYDLSLELDSKYAFVWTNKGDALGELGRYDGAIECYDKALKIKPKYAFAWNNKGIILAELGRYEDAIACYDRTLEINPKDEKVKQNRKIAEEKLREKRIRTPPETPSHKPTPTTHLSLDRTIYDPTTQDFIISTPRPLPNIRNWIEKNDPGMYWLVICINNNIDRPIDEWGIEIETPTTLRILEAGIEGSDQEFSLIASSPKPWLTNWILGISHHLGIVIPRGGSKRIYFKLASDACGTSYSIAGKVSTAEWELPLEEKRFRFSCDKETLGDAIRTDPERAQGLTREIHPNSGDILIPLQAFRILQGLEQCCRLGEYEDVIEKMRTLLNLLEGAQVGDGLISMVSEHYEVTKRLSEGSPDFSRRIGKLCGNFVDEWTVEVLKG